MPSIDSEGRAIFRSKDPELSKEKPGNEMVSLGQRSAKGFPATAFK